MVFLGLPQHGGLPPPLSEPGMGPLPLTLLVAGSTPPLLQVMRREASLVANTPLALSTSAWA